MELNINHCGTNYFLRFSLLVIERKMKKKWIEVKATEGKGYLTIKSRRPPKANIGTPG